MHYDKGTQDERPMATLHYETLLPITLLMLGFTGALITFVARHIDLNEQPPASFDLGIEVDRSPTTVIFFDDCDCGN